MLGGSKNVYSQNMQRARKRSRDQGRWLSCSCACHKHEGLPLITSTQEAHTCNSSPGVEGAGTRFLGLADQQSRLNQWALGSETVFQIRHRVIEEYTQHWPLTSSCPCTHRHAHLYIQFNFKRKCIKYVNYQLTTEAITTVPVTFMTKYVKRCVTQIVGRLDWNKTFPNIEWVCSCTAEDWRQGRAHTAKCSTTRYLLCPY